MKNRDRDRDRDRGRSRFKYHKRSLESLKARAEQKGGAFDRTYKSAFKVFTPKEGESTIRVLPPTWTEPKPDHYGLDIWLHGNVGPDNQTYLCLQKMKGEDCPVCEAHAERQEEANEADRKGDKDAAKKLNEEAYQLKAKKKVLMWVIVRGESEREGPMLYPMPWTLDKNLTDRMIDKRSGDWLAVDDPDEGYDLTFKREGTRQNTKYVGETVARNPSPLYERNPKRADEWLQFIEDNPIPDTLQYYEYDYIDKVFNGTKADDEEEDEEEERPSRKGRKDADEDERPSRKSRRDEDEDEEDEDDDEEEEERPSRKSSKRKDDDEDEDEDDRPRKSKKKDIDDPDEEIDEDDDSEEDEEEDRPKKKKRVALDRASKDDEDEDEDSEDDEDEPKPAKGKAKASRRDEDDEDEDEEEEEERPRKAKASKREEKPRRRSRDDESGADGDDDIPF